MNEDGDHGDIAAPPYIKMGCNYCKTSHCITTDVEKELESLRQSLAQEKERSEKFQKMYAAESVCFAELKKERDVLEADDAAMTSALEKIANVSYPCNAVQVAHDALKLTSGSDLLKRLELLEGALGKAEDAISETLNWADAAGQSGYWYDHLDESRDKLSSLLNSPGVGKESNG